MRKTVVTVLAHRPKSIGGMECYARELSSQLGRRGWRSELVFAGHPSPEVERYLDLPNTEWHVVERCGHRTWRPMLAIAKLLREIRPRIAHFHFIDPCTGYAWLAKLSRSQDIYITDHISRPTGHGDRTPAGWRRAARRFLYAPVSRTFCVSAYVRECNMREGPLSDGRLVLLYNGVDCTRAELGRQFRDVFRRRHGISSDEVVVMQASWLIPEKGIDTLLEAASVVLRRHENVRFLIAGEGAHRDEYETMAQRLGIADRVVFAGQIGDPLGEGLYAASDIVCQLSRWGEAFGLTIAEAMASAKPVVASRIGGIPELVRDGESGYLVEPGDAEAAADRIARLVERPGLRQTMGLQAHEASVSTFNLRTNVAELLDHYGCD